jgi:hypothetical protein
VEQGSPLSLPEVQVPQQLVLKILQQLALTVFTKPITMARAKRYLNIIFYFCKEKVIE